MASVHFRDGDGVAQGPFSVHQMLEWLEGRYFVAETLEISLNGPDGIWRTAREFYPGDTPVFGCDPEGYFFLDGAGEVQGPFPALNMKRWYEGGHFSLQTKIRGVLSGDDFAPISDVFGDGVAPFEGSAPSSASAGLTNETRLGDLRLSGDAAVDELDVWCYLDADGNLQGPFSAAYLKYWLEEGTFFDDMVVCLQDESGTSTQPASAVSDHTSEDHDDLEDVDCVVAVDEEGLNVESVTVGIVSSDVTPAMSSLSSTEEHSTKEESAKAMKKDEVSEEVADATSDVKSEVPNHGGLERACQSKFCADFPSPAAHLDSPQISDVLDKAELDSEVWSAQSKAFSEKCRHLERTACDFAVALRAIVR